MQFIRNIIRRYPLSGVINWFHVKKKTAQWTAHDHKTLGLYSQFISCGAFGFDVGANMGNLVKIFLKLQTTVIVGRPQNGCVKILKVGYGSNKH